LNTFTCTRAARLSWEAIVEAVTAAGRTGGGAKQEGESDENRTKAP